MNTHANSAAERLARTRELINVALHDSAAPTPAMMALQWAAQRHPVGLVSCAAGLGAAVVWSRPWRWSPRPSPLTAGLWPKLGSLALAAVLASAAPPK